jgi:sulfatase maturation enzyme AslB (radical SAM superfamily)
MKKTDNSAFCVKPFTQYSSFNDGYFRLCCSAHEPQERIWTRGQSVESIFNGDYLRSIRQGMIEGRKIMECSACYKLEDQGARSDREEANLRYLNSNRSFDFGKLEKNNFVVDAIEVMDLRVGNICNLRCQSCFPDLSTGVHGERKILINEHPHLFDQAIGEKVLAAGFELNQVKKSLETVKLLKLIGGEPLLSSQALELLKFCVQSGLSQNIELHFHSNLTVWNVEFYEYVKEFKSVMLHFSMDGYDKLNSYLRYPSNWQVCVANLEKSIKFFREQPSVRLGVSPVIQITNLIGVTQLLKFFLKEIDFIRNRIILSPILLVDPDYYSPYIVPSSLRDLAISSYQDFYSTLNSSEKIYLEGFTKEFMSIRTGKSNAVLLKKYLEVTRAYDKLRGQIKVEDVFPELYYIEKYVSEYTLDEEGI